MQTKQNPNCILIVFSTPHDSETSLGPLLSSPALALLKHSVQVTASNEVHRHSYRPEGNSLPWTCAEAADPRARNDQMISLLLQTGSSIKGK